MLITHTFKDVPRIQNNLGYDIPLGIAKRIWYYAIIQRLNGEVTSKLTKKHYTIKDLILTGATNEGFAFWDAVHTMSWRTPDTKTIPEITLTLELPEVTRIYNSTLPIELSERAWKTSLDSFRTGLPYLCIAADGSKTMPLHLMFEYDLTKEGREYWDFVAAYGRAPKPEELDTTYQVTWKGTIKASSLRAAVLKAGDIAPVCEGRVIDVWEALL